MLLPSIIDDVQLIIIYYEVRKSKNHQAIEKTNLFAVLICQIRFAINGFLGKTVKKTCIFVSVMVEWHKIVKASNSMSERKSSGKNLINLRKSNKKRILELLCANGPLYGSDIARRINLSIGGTANITDEMLADGLLEKSDAWRVVRGRRPYMLRINARVGVVASILVNEKIKLCVSDFSGSTMYCVDLSYETLTVDVFNSVTEILKKYLQKSGEKLYAVSVGLGGKIDKNTGEFVYAPSVQNSMDVNLKKMFSEAFSVPVSINTNVVFEMIAEKRYNTNVDIYNTLYVDNLGCSMFVGGKLFTGQHGFAGELGLLDIDIYSETLSKYCKAIVERRANYFMSPYVGMFSPEEAENTARLADAYRRGDPEVVEKFNGFFDLYARVLRNIVEFMDFDNVIIRGDIAQFGESAIAYIENELADSRFGRLDIKVYPSVLGADAALKGSIIVALEESFDALVSENSR